MFRKIILTAAAIIALSSQASAQGWPDLSAPAQDWSGPEVGVQVGYVLGNSSGDDQCAPAWPGCALPYDFHADGVIGGVHGGYNWQFGNVVAGLEADVEGAGVAHDDRFAAFSTRYAFKTSMDYNNSVRAKLGWGFDNVLLYATAGGDFGDVETKYSCAGCLGPSGNYAKIHFIRSGWTAGGGFEYALTSNWETGVEYRYTDLGTKGYYSVAKNSQDSNEFNFSGIRVNITYRFSE